MDNKGSIRQSARDASTKTGLLLLFIAILTMLLATKSSPLYPLNNWVDANAIFTTGKAMFNGKVLYRDVFDHKGPILHFLHGLAWLISHKSFFGIWLLEVAACYFTLLFSYRILEMYTDKRSILMMPVFAVLLYTGNSLCHGDSAEEFCLPMLMYAVFLIVRSLKEKEDISPKHLFLLGVTSGCILWIKYSLLGFYLGWVIVPLFLAIRNKNWKYILNMVLFIGAGVLSVTVVVLSYFLINGALYDLWDVYFYTNIFKYALPPNGLYSDTISYVARLCKVITKNYALVICMVLGGIWAVVKRKFLLFVQIALMLLVGSLFIYGRAYPFDYYFMIFVGFSIIGFIPVYGLISKTIAKWNAKLYAGILLGMCVLTLPATGLLGENTDMLQYEKEDMPQYQFAEIINQKEDATLLNYGFMDGGFYTVTGIVPNVRYFCAMNVNLQEILEMHEETIRNGTVDFVVTQDTKLNSDHYEEQMVSKMFFEGREHEYTLYRKVD